MMMSAHPDLVVHERVAEALGPNSSSTNMLHPAIMRWRSFADLTATGVIGDARRASSEKGERLLTVVSESLAEALVSGHPWTN